MGDIRQVTRLLNAATGVGAGTAFNMQEPFQTFTFMKTTVQGGGFSALGITYEGSLDGTTWFTLATDATTTDGVTFVVDKPCIYVRANVTAFTGGTSVTVNCVGNVN